MSICDRCIHDEVCGLEDNHEEATTFCAHIVPKDILDKIRDEIDQIPTVTYTETRVIYINPFDFKENVLAIIDKHKAEIEPQESEVENGDEH